MWYHRYNDCGHFGVLKSLEERLFGGYEKEGENIAVISY